MATYDSVHTGQQVDEAVDIVLANKNKGTSDTPVYLDANGAAVNINKATSVTQNDSKLITSGAAFTGLSLKYNKADIVTDPNLGTSNVLIPSCGAVKTYVDNQVATKQVPVSAGDNVNITNNVISVVPSDDMITMKELDNKWNHFTSELSGGYRADLIEKMKNAKRTSFGRSKFTVVGSPIVTSDGIAEGFSGHNYLTIPTFKANNTYKISFVMNTKDYKSGNRWQSPYSEGRISYISNGIYTELETQASQLRFVIGNGSQQQGITTVGIQEYTTYKVDFEFDGTSYKLYLDGVLKASATATVFRGNTTSTITMIGGSYEGSSTTNSYVFEGSIDLKSIYIIADGVEVFNGNKEGVDTIKPDDYTVTGTPTISADGVASGFSTSNYITKSITIDTSKPFIINGTFKTGVSVGNYEAILSLVSTVNTQCFYEFRRADNKTSLNVVCSASETTRNSFFVTNVFQDNTQYYYKIEFDGTNVKLYIGITFENLALVHTAIPYILSITQINFGVSYGSSIPFIGSIDLNAFKVYANGDLIYQPCLKIPYTLTRDGKKIVDYNYKSRVEDEYTQAGYTPYYTLDTESRGNYQVVGSPTISSDFVASGFSSGSYIKISNIDIVNKPYTLKYKAQFSQSASPDFPITIYDGVKSLGLYQLATNMFQLVVAPSGSSYQYGTITGIISNFTTKECDITIDVNNNGATATIICDDVSYTSTIAFENLLFTQAATVDICRYMYTINSIDLKEFKIYVDNKLAYQAVIPPNYTMATVKPSDIIDSYDNGVTKWTKYADLTLKQTGSWTAGSAVTFDKKFRDTNYAITVPYTSGTKLVTGFTPSAASGAGDWVAIGKTTLD